MLDVRDPHAIRRLAAEVGEVDIVFSNAAARMSPDDDPADAVDVVADTNNTATTMMLREFAPRLRDGGRLIVVASALGTLDKLPASVRPRFAEAAAADLDAVDRLVDEWRHSVKAGRAVREGFGSWLNIPSKVAQVAAVRAIARTRRSDDLQHGTLVMALCPGLIDTEASRPWFSRHEQRSERRELPQPGPSNSPSPITSIPRTTASSCNSAPCCRGIEDPTVTTTITGQATDKPS